MEEISFIRKFFQIEHRTDINIEPKFKMQAIPLSKVSEYTGSCVDVLAIIERVGELTQVNSFGSV